MFDCASEVMSHSSHPDGGVTESVDRVISVALHEGGWSADMQSDKAYVMNLISDIRKHRFNTLAPEDGHCCNGLWRKYE